MAALEQKQKEVGTPLERIFQCTQARLLDFFLENHGIEVSHDGIQNNMPMEQNELESSLQILVDEKLIHEHNGKYSLINNSRSHGFFEYFRATIDHNLENYEHPSKH